MSSTQKENVPISPSYVASKNSALKRKTSNTLLNSTGTKEAKVKVLYTGGTIGMIRNEKNVLAPMPNAFVKRIRTYPNMHDEEYAKRRFGSSSPLLVLPYVEGENNRVLYEVAEYMPLLDSSNMTMHDWARIANDIHHNYEAFDGFVVLHGTDTLSYTASALSFMLENLGKTVIITGSQIPIFETRTDGNGNFTSALIIAGNYVIPEVCVFFGNKLIRGNRTVKMSSNSLDAFNSLNVPPLAHIGVDVNIDYRLIFRPCQISKFNVHSQLDKNGVVLQSFGAGNVPSNRRDLLEQLKEATDRGVLILNCTQCPNGSVTAIYETGQILFDLGVLPGFDMTPEAALTKLSYVLSKQNWSLDVKKQMMQTNLRGELTSSCGPKMEEYDLIDAVARSLHISSPEELKQLGATLFPAMLGAAVLAGDIQKINNLNSYGACLSGVNQDHRTALHLACSENNLPVVRHLLLNGVSVHIRDRYERTPLMEAIANDNHEIISLLINCGAHLTGSSRAIGEQLCAAAARGFLTRLKSYQLAGADLSQPDPSGRTALHVAALHGHQSIVDYLLDHMDNIKETDMLGLTALDYGVMSGEQEISNVLNNYTHA